MTLSTTHLQLAAPFINQSYQIPYDLHESAKVRFFGKEMHIQPEIAIPPFIAALPGILFSQQYDVKSVKEKVIYHLGSFVMQPVSAALQATSMLINLVAAGFFKTASAVSRLFNKTSNHHFLANEHMKSALLNFDLIFVHLCATVYPGFLQ